jgi:hypothetical protein
MLQPFRRWLKVANDLLHVSLRSLYMPCGVLRQVSSLL